MSEWRRETVEMSSDDFDTIVEACVDAGLQAKIISGQINITGHGIKTYGAPVVYVRKHGENVEFSVDLHTDRNANNLKFQELKTKVHAHFKKIQAIKAAKKLGWSVAKNSVEEDVVVVRVRKFI